MNGGGVKIVSLPKEEQIKGCFDSAKWSGFVWNKVYRKGFIGTTKFGTKGSIIEDLIFNMELMITETDQNTAFYTPESLYQYRIAPNSLSHSISDRAVDTFEDYEKLLNLLNAPEYSSVIPIICNARVNLARSILENSWNISGEKYAEFLPACKREILENKKYIKSLSEKIGIALILYCPQLIKPMRRLMKVAR